MARVVAIASNRGLPAGLKTGLRPAKSSTRPQKNRAVALANADLDSTAISETVVTWVKRSRYNPLRQLTPDYLSRIIDTWNNGYLREFALMADAIKHRDPIINIALRKREKGVARHGFEVLLLDGLTGALKARGEKHQRRSNGSSITSASRMCWSRMYPAASGCWSSR